MQKYLSFLLMSFIAVAFTGCKDEDSSLIFSVENISDPKNITVEYYSPDPGSVSKRYWITANSNAGTLTLKCTNHNSIYIDDLYKEVDPHIQVSEEGRWTAKIVTPNSITFTFDKVTGNPEKATASQWVILSANTETGKDSTFVTVRRLLLSDEPLDEL